MLRTSIVRTFSRSYATAASPHALVFLEHQRGKLDSASLSALTAASQLGGKVTGLIVGTADELPQALDQAKKYTLSFMYLFGSLMRLLELRVWILYCMLLPHSTPRPCPKLSPRCSRSCFQSSLLLRMLLPRTLRQPSPFYLAWLPNLMCRPSPTLRRCNTIHRLTARHSRVQSTLAMQSRLFALLNPSLSRFSRSARQLSLPLHQPMQKLQ